MRCNEYADVMDMQRANTSKLYLSNFIFSLIIELLSIEDTTCTRLVNFISESLWLMVII